MKACRQGNAKKPRRPRRPACATADVPAPSRAERVVPSDGAAKQARACCGIEQAHRPAAPRLALGIGEACDALGVGWDLWHEQIEPEIRLVRLGRRKLVPVSELRAWLERHAARAF